MYEALNKCDLERVHIRSYSCKYKATTLLTKTHSLKTNITQKFTVFILELEYTTFWRDFISWMN